MKVLILLGHGSRDPIWRVTCERIAAQIAPQTPHPVCLAYLEWCEPRLADVVAEYVVQGMNHMIIAPLLIGMGQHCRDQIPQLVHDLQKQHPKVTFEILQAAGEAPIVQQAISQWALQGLQDYKLN